MERREREYQASNQNQTIAHFSGTDSVDHSSCKLCLQCIFSVLKTQSQSANPAGLFGGGEVRAVK